MVQGLLLVVVPLLVLAGLLVLVLVEVRLEQAQKEPLKSQKEPLKFQKEQ